MEVVVAFNLSDQLMTMAVKGLTSNKIPKKLARWTNTHIRQIPWAQIMLMISHLRGLKA